MGPCSSQQRKPVSTSQALVPGLNQRMQRSFRYVPISLRHQNKVPQVPIIKLRKVWVQVVRYVKLGAFGEVRLVIHKSSGYKRAMKQIRKDKIIKEDEENMFSEVNTLKELDHPNIVKLHELFQDAKNYYLVTEYLEGGELFQKITDMKHFSEKMAADIMKQILAGVVHCHEKKVVHRDLKPENILFENKKPNSNLKIIDFGTSRKMETNQNLTKRLGTPYYIAPEVLKRNYNEKCDVWSCGVILYIMLCGYPPFGGQDQQILQNIELGKYEFDPEDWNKISEDAKNLIKRMLTKDYQLRISAQEAYNDPWIQKNAPNGPIDMKAIKNLSSFFGKNKVRAALMQFITTNLMTNTEKEGLLNEFKKIDKDGNGQISKDELLQVYMKQYDEIKAKQMVDDIFEKVDINRSGFVDFTEFMMSASSEEKLLSKIKLQQAFNMFDTNGDGQISREELQEIMGGVDDNLWTEILQMCDANGDGQISQQEFIDFLVKKYQQ
uniref:Calcium-dependent protein kinase 1 n=1 Tax=Paramecium tetraurelia TaxID=5888 RepID=O15872_PARTE|nr:calcium-dependent protein kinase-b [Paramecium tetraurelia]